MAERALLGAGAHQRRRAPLVLPKNATPEQVAQWRTENGIPEAPTSTTQADGGKGADEDKPLIDGLLKTLHAQERLGNAGASAAVDWYYEEVQQRTNERLQKDVDFARQTEDALRTEWGGEYKLNMQPHQGPGRHGARGRARAHQGRRLANGDPLLSHPGSLKWLVGMAREINPPTALVPNGSSNPSQAIDTRSRRSRAG
jgi:hypothetical protein